MTHDQMANLGVTLNMIMLLAENDNDMKRLGNVCMKYFHQGTEMGLKEKY